MRFERRAVLIECVECLDVWLPDDEERWRAYPDADGEVAFYCAACAAREFDGE